MNRLLRHLLPVRPSPAPRRWRATPRLLALEDRVTPTTDTVTTADDGGAGSLRDAIVQANAFAGADLINFDTAGVFATAQTISLLAALPAITDALTVTGTGSALLTV